MVKEVVNDEHIFLYKNYKNYNKRKVKVKSIKNGAAKVYAFVNPNNSWCEVNFWLNKFWKKK